MNLSLMTLISMMMFSTISKIKWMCMILLFTLIYEESACNLLITKKILRMPIAVMAVHNTDMIAHKISDHLKILCPSEYKDVSTGVSTANKIKSTSVNPL